ncbi:Hypothetical predicted protein [Mytilus galloprovincialis]|uniref:Uncharacterized protein n=1 Tax=Mytilus galloprovincialis TaxID=29158 RepID=A0A8B6GJ09_MYTGA|nr:Hypothetical predicted protein [Mytilus galloprovincialis]
MRLMLHTCSYIKNVVASNPVCSSFPPELTANHWVSETNIGTLTFQINTAGEGDVTLNDPNNPLVVTLDPERQGTFHRGRRLRSVERACIDSKIDVYRCTSELIPTPVPVCAPCTKTQAECDTPPTTQAAVPTEQNIPNIISPIATIPAEQSVPNNVSPIASNSQVSDPIVKIEKPKTYQLEI